MTTDAVIIGAGPVGLTAALLMARQGLRVDVLEKLSSPCVEPRAVSVDDEALRIWQSCGIGDRIARDWSGGEIGKPMCTYYGSRGRAFLRLMQRASDLGFPHAASIHQGRIDLELWEAAAAHPLIRILAGHRVDRIEQDALEVRVRATGPSGAIAETAAPWTIACDGAGGITRQLLGVSLHEQVSDRPWLVANMIDDGPPGHVEIRCGVDGARVTMPMPHGTRRVEVQLGTHDDGNWLSDEARVRAALARAWPQASHAPIVRATVRRFKSAVAEQWRIGRVFLAGDAAHVMPPYAGQGLCAGLRDAANLTFKIAGVRHGWLSPVVLDTYESERRPHVERMTRLSSRLGRLMCPRSQLEAAVMQSSLSLAGALPQMCKRWMLRGPSIRPRLKSGFMVRSRGAGDYLPQPLVTSSDGQRVLLDELLGTRMTWLILSSTGNKRSIAAPPLVQPLDTVLWEGRDFIDSLGVLRSRYGAGSAVLVRPDRIVYASIPQRDLLTHTRSNACRADVIAVREVQPACAQPHSQPLPPAAASLTAQTPQ